MGSGSTMVACAMTGRKGIGIELMEQYYDTAVKTNLRLYSKWKIQKSL